VLRDALERFNEWWLTGSVRRDLALPFRRYAFSRVEESLGERQVLVVTWLRRVGKTTTLYQSIDRLHETVDLHRILYFSFEGSSAGPGEVLDFYERNVLRKTVDEAGRAYIFSDEIQYANV